MRTHYRNGDDITLVENGCDGCDPASINSVLSHERGCPFSWKDYEISCCICGYDFIRSDLNELRCVDCIADDEEMEQMYCGGGNRE